MPAIMPLRILWKCKRRVILIFIYIIYYIYYNIYNIYNI